MTYPLTPVRWFHSGMADAPVLNGTPGAQIALLDACLINGFGNRTLDGITISGGIATALLGSGNPFERHAVIRISGATPAGLNGDHRILTASASSFTFPVPGLGDGDATGPITCLRSPAGWTKPHSGTFKAAYQSADPGSTQLYLRLGDSDPLYCDIRGYENLSDIDTGSGLFPTAAQQPNWWWTKSNQANATARPWALVADGSLIWLTQAWNASYPLLGTLDHFGDITPFGSDAYGCGITAQQGTKGVSSPWSYNPTTVSLDSTSYPRYLARLADGTGGPVHSGLVGPAISTNSFSTYGTSAATADVGGGVQIGSPLYIRNGSGTNTPLRGILPGARPVFQSNPFTLTAGTIVAPVQEAGGGLFLPVSVLSVSSSTPSQVALDILGPWR